MISKQRLKELLIGIVGIGLFFLIFQAANTNMKKIEDSIENNKIETVGRIFKITSRRSFTDAEYYYYYKNKKYESYQSIDGSGNEYLNHFYVVNISSQNPQYSKIFLNKEITDLSQIKNAGFKEMEKFMWKYPAENNSVKQDQFRKK